MKPIICSLIVLVVLGLPTRAQTANKLLILPFQQTAGLHTWLLGQAYGNTTGAYNFGTRWYSAGQGLHFGLDFSAPCGTPLVAVADGVVAFVDDLNFGSAPHNLILRHEALGLTSLYGHLQEPSPLSVGETVTQGQFVGYTGDPDETCDSRPHLHLEIRSLDYRTAFNPVDYMDANWESLALVGRFGSRFFQTDLDNARRWVTLDDQPTVSFGGRRLNDYIAAYPPSGDQLPPSNPLIAQPTPPITGDTSTAIQALETSGCCWEFWWHPTDPVRAFAIDGFAGQRASHFEFDVVNAEITSNLGTAPPPNYSPDYSHRIALQGDVAVIENINTGEVWQVATTGALPALSSDNSRLVWITREDAAVPGLQVVNNTIFISDARGQNVGELVTWPGIEAQWLDESRLLLTTRQRPYTQLDVYDTATGESFTLGRWYRPRGFNIAPGGERLLFYLPQQPDPANTGLYWMDIAQDAQLQRLDWFGAYQWRDADGIFFIPFDPASNVHQLKYYDIPTGNITDLTNPSTQPFTIKDGRWSVNADGSRIVFRNALDLNLWQIVLE